MVKLAILVKLSQNLGQSAPLTPAYIPNRGNPLDLLALPFMPDETEPLLDPHHRPSQGEGARFLC